jgi:hypothetical protein
MHYTDKKDTAPDFCFISVEQWDGAQGTVCFQRQFPASSIPASVLTAKAKDVFSFDSGSRRVTFNIGATNYTYTLPQTP